MARAQPNTKSDPFAALSALELLQQAQTLATLERQDPHQVDLLLHHLQVCCPLPTSCYELLKLGALVGELVYRSSGSQEGRCAPCAMSPTRWLLLVSYVEPEPYVAAPNPCPLQMNLGVLDAKSMAAALMAIAEGLGARSGQILMPQVRLL